MVLVCVRVCARARMCRVCVHGVYLHRSSPLATPFGRRQSARAQVQNVTMTKKDLERIDSEAQEKLGTLETVRARARARARAGVCVCVGVCACVLVFGVSA